MAIFNNVKKTILSKSFEGGEVVNVVGNVKINFMQADMAENVVLDLSMVFCKTKIIVPADWRVICDTHAVFAAVDDKRYKNTIIDYDQKTLILKGTALFSQIELRSI